MIEITHAPDERKERTRRIPKNIRQIGNVGGYGKIYMEDMVYQFLQEGGIEEGQNLVTYLLLGEDFYQNEELVALTKELTEMLRKNRTIDWQKKETARATMRKMVKRLLKKYKYPPEDYDFAINTVISQCELWTDNASMA